VRNETIAVHGGYDGDPTTKAVAVPIYQTAAYEFDSAEHGAALFNLEESGFRYSRINNPTVDVLDKRVAALEGGVGALCVASGQAALHYALLNLTEMGANFVTVPQLYGTTHTLFSHLLPSFGITVRFAKSDHPADVEPLIDANTRAVFCESVGNPAGNICDIEALAEVAHDSGKFPWKQHAERFRMFCEPDASYHGLVYADHFGPSAYIARCRSVYQRTTGAVLSPFSAFLLLQGIETVALRVERHVENARRVAEFLRADKRVAWVNYVGFPDSPYHRLAEKYLGGRACSLLTFGTHGGLEGGMRFYNALKLVKRLVNLGDAKSLACHPASTTHRQMPAEDQIKAGLRPEMIRLSVGIEHVDDIVADLDQALAQSFKPERE
jgi:O-acetylhomoserine (thiol)-lyase